MRACDTDYTGPWLLCPRYRTPSCSQCWVKEEGNQAHPGLAQRPCGHGTSSLQFQATKGHPGFRAGWLSPTTPPPTPWSTVWPFPISGNLPDLSSGGLCPDWPLLFCRKNLVTSPGNINRPALLTVRSPQDSATGC